MCPVHSQCLHNHCLWPRIGGRASSQHHSLNMDFLEGTGVKTSGAGEGRPFKQGEIEEGELTGRGGLLSFSGDFSLSKT